MEISGRKGLPCRELTCKNTALQNAYSISCDRVEVFPQYISGPTGFRSEMCGLANHMVGCCLRKSMVVVMSRSIVHSSKGKPKEVCRTRRCVALPVCAGVLLSIPDSHY